MNELYVYTAKSHVKNHTVTNHGQERVCRIMVNNGNLSITVVNSSSRKVCQWMENWARYLFRWLV